ncbi:c-type cytochrome domain-containing protein [Catenovulum agarivorans]|uniref:c-type cytochrome domain-containing protein n=1 Tax=Catenovulum agarivorans TaxID=1172192 RepID=UPI0002D34973|nr:c-type cytochrome domain-containing protein [Catenovulum agarivorans]
MNQVTPKQQLKAKRYLYFVLALSILWIVMFIQSQAEWVQNIKESIGLVPILQAKENSFYNQRIDPIFEKYCVSCHDGNKDKGHLRLDSYRQLTFSGRSEADLTVAENNLLVERMKLPADDRLAMPPYGRERHSEAELELIKLWLAKGGSGELTEDDFPEAPAKAKVIKFADINWQHIEQLREPLQPQVSALQNQFPSSVSYLARTSHLLSVNLSHSAMPITDQQLTAFQPVAELIAELNLNRSGITDASAQALIEMTELQSLNISQTQATAQLLEQVMNLPNLKTVFADSKIVDQVLLEKFTQQGIRLHVVERG